MLPARKLQYMDVNLDRYRKNGESQIIIRIFPERAELFFCIDHRMTAKRRKKTKEDILCSEVLKYSHL